MGSHHGQRIRQRRERSERNGLREAHKKDGPEVPNQEVEQGCRRGSNGTGRDDFASRAPAIGHAARERRRKQSNCSACRENQANLLGWNAARLDESGQVWRGYAEGGIKEAIKGEEAGQWPKL